MTRQQEILRQVTIFVSIGLALFAIAFFAPDAAHRHGAFLQVARQTTWNHVLDLPAAWASIKIILFSIGLFLVIESLGTVFSLLKMKALAMLSFILQVLPFLGLICGSYYLVKSLL